MGEESLSQVGPAAVSLLALLLSLFNLYLQRRDRRPRLEIRARYEYRVDTPDRASDTDTLPRYTTLPKKGCTCCWGTS
jgi:hypothetical protein